MDFSGFDLCARRIPTVPRLWMKTGRLFQAQVFHRIASACQDADQIRVILFYLLAALFELRDPAAGV